MASNGRDFKIPKENLNHLNNNIVNIVDMFKAFVFNGSLKLSNMLHGLFLSESLFIHV